MRKSKQPTEYGPHYQAFLQLEARFRQHWSTTNTTYLTDLTRDELALLNGYKVNTEDEDVHVVQGFDLRAVEIYSTQAAHRLAMYCMVLDYEWPV